MPLDDLHGDVDGLPSYKSLMNRQDAPPGSSWGLFGTDDQVGTLNFLKLASLVDSAAEVRAGTAFSLDVPSDTFASALSPSRKPVQHHIFQHDPYHRDEWLDSFYPQYGSQVDGLRHIGHPDYGFYNGADAGRLVPGDELLSIHHMAALPIVARGVLLDVDRYLRSQGRPIDQHSSRGVTLQDLENTLESQGTELRPGDAVLVRFGWLHWYRTSASPEQKARLTTEPIHPGLAQSHSILAWLWNHRVSMVAGDNFALERWPAAADSPFRTRVEQEEALLTPHTGMMHRSMIALLGMPIGELWNLDALGDACASARRWTFLLCSAPFALVGGVGSPANAIAVN